MMPDRIQITHQDPMTTPNFRTLCAELLQAWQFGDDIAGPMNRARTALKAEPTGQRPTDEDLYSLAEQFNGDPVPAMRHALEVWGNPLPGAPAPGEKLAAVPTPQPEGDWFTVAAIAQDMRSRGLAAQVAGEELLMLANGKRLQPGNPATHPALEPPSPSGYAYRYRSPFGGTCIRFNGGEEVNGGRPIEAVPYWFAPPSAPATPPAPEPRPTFQDTIRLAEGCHDYSGGHSGAKGEAWHGAISTVVGVLKRAAVGPWDSQTRAVFGVGVEAQAGEVSVPVAELDDQRREAVYQAVAEALGSGAYDCLRVWSAWSCGTMGPDDFVPVAKDDDRVAEIADAAIEAIRAIPAPQAGEVGELVALLKIAGRWATSTGVHLDRFAALFDQQAAELATLRGVPVAVSERRPEAKDCLFNEGATIGKCWCFNPELEGVPWWSFEPLEWAENATHWLPCNAIPLPRLGRWRCEAENTHSSNS
jgi:hypothetical protein